MFVVDFLKKQRSFCQNLDHANSSFFAYANRVIYLIFNEKKQMPLLTYQLLMEMVGQLG